MKLADLPEAAIDDLCQDDRWRLDIDPGFDAKHEFWMVWRHFIALPEEPSPYYEKTEDNLADFLNFEGFEVLLPVERSHHPKIELVRLIPSADNQTLTLFLHDSYHESWFSDRWGARYGFLAVADRYQKFDCDFYIANYYHFSYLVREDYEVAQRIMDERDRL
jgi:hypothetical protein